MDRLHGDDRADDFIERNFDEEVLRTFRGFPLGVMRADFWRYAVLYMHGGIYADVDTNCTMPVEQWLPPKDNAAKGLPLEAAYNKTTWKDCSILIGMENGEHFCQWVRVCSSNVFACIAKPTNVI